MQGGVPFFATGHNNTLMLGDFAIDWLPPFFLAQESTNNDGRFPLHDFKHL